MRTSTAGGAGGAGRGVGILELLLLAPRGLDRDLPFRASAPCAQEVGRLLHGGVGRLEVLLSRYRVPDRDLDSLAPGIFAEVCRALHDEEVSVLEPVGLP